MAGVPSSADFVVIGLGSAGCVVLDRLSEDGRYTVAGIEAGGSTTHPAVKVPALIQKQPTRLNWLYPVRPDASRDGIADPYSAGRGLGGSSAINAMLWVRGNPGDYDGWAAAGAAGWSWAEVAPSFLKSERFEEAGAYGRGTQGRISVTRSRVSNPLIEAFVEAADQAGLPALEDFNGPRQIGASRSQVSQVRGMRHSTGDAYLARTRSRRNVKVVTGTTATRIVIEDGRATGVEIVDEQGQRHRIRARREVILSAGAIGSPKLLQLSGIGPADLLTEFGIPVLVDAPEIGRGLQDHPATSLVFEVTERTVNQEVTPLRLLGHAADFALRGHGALTTTANHAVAFGPAGSQSGVPDTELVFMAFGLAPADAVSAEVADAPAPGLLTRLTARSGGREENRRQVATESLVTVTAVALHSHGRGSVEIGSADPLDPPVITQELLGDPRDVAALTSAARLARSVFEAPALAAKVVGERSPGTAVETDEEWADHLRANTFRLFHQAGTCRMGGPDAPVDPRLRVRGVAGLRVVDASVMPTLPSGNTNAPTIMIGERASSLILADQG